uniref:Uncharacterized protein n=1 Tax=viral metagenome TaxID=1070528 RepID=A0A6C0API9_9ZZZZ
MARKTVRSLKTCIQEMEARKQEKLAKGEDTTQEDIQINKCTNTLNHTRKQRKGYKKRVKNQSRSQSRYQNQQIHQNRQNQLNQQTQPVNQIVQPVVKKPELVLDKTGTVSLSPVRHNHRKPKSRHNTSRASFKREL